MEEEHRSEGALRDTAPEPRYRGSNNMYRGKSGEHGGAPAPLRV